MVRSRLTALLLPIALAVLVVIPADGNTTQPSATAGAAATEGYKYRSDAPGSAYEWLEEQQRRAYGPTQRPPSLDELRRVIASLPRRDGWEAHDTILKAVKLDEVVLPTRYEDVASYFLTQNLSQGIREAAIRLGSAQVIPSIVWGTLPTGEVNAAAQKIGSENVVILNRGLFAFLYGTLLTSSRTISIRTEAGGVALDFSDSTFKRIYETNSSLSSDFKNLVSAFASRSTVPDIRFASALEAPLVIRQLNAVERFIVAHEFGHILARDTERGVRMLNLPNAAGGWRKVSTIGRDWAQELRADATGLELGASARTFDESGATGLASPLFEAVAAYAPVLFLVIADALENATFCEASGEGSRSQLPQVVVERLVSKALGVRESGEPPSSNDPDIRALGCRVQTHPPAWLRAELLLPAIDKKLVGPPQQASRDVLLAKALIENTKQLSALTRSAIRIELTAAGIAR